MSTSMTAIPEILHAHAGEILDADSHEYTPMNHWEDEFGSVVRDFVAAFEGSKMPIREHVETDETPIAPETVWTTKFAHAPGAFDLDRRLQVLDLMGVRRQMLFPGSIGLYAVSFYFRCDQFPDMLASITGDRKAYARRLITAYNEWCMRVTDQSDRLRPVAVLLADTLEELMAECRRLVEGGVRGIWMPSSAMPGGRSPAHPDLDPMWSMLASTDVPVLAHVGSDADFLMTTAWRDAPAFVGWKAGEEFQMDPWTLSTLHLPVQNFLTTMVLGGVFERHPRLRFGACEVLGQWVGPLAQRLDFWNLHSRKFSLDNREGELPITLPPSEYIRRNVRISLFDIEPVDVYIEKFGLSEVYCYSSDYPHPEGGLDPMGDISGKLARLGPDVMRQVFVENAKWLLPD
ncbi:MAG: amidohydrolase family protein [Deltaproteobacteria bacterium]|nr:amidohydrolase family protein [Deltaproteobacteria bacterium]